MSSKPWWMVPALIAPVAISAPAFAVQYLSVEQAQKTMFPAGSRFLDAPIKLTAEAKERIEAVSGVRVRSLEQRAWKVEAKGKPAGWLLVDEVIGKHELITYGVALTADGAVSGVEIMEYRETHGGEVKSPEWRAQFVGKRNGAPLKLDEDIKNISGATLSSKNVTNGVKRLLATYDVALK